MSPWLFYTRLMGFPSRLLPGSEVRADGQHVGTWIAVVVTTSQFTHRFVVDLVEDVLHVQADFPVLVDLVRRQGIPDGTPAVGYVWPIDIRRITALCRDPAAHGQAVPVALQVVGGRGPQHMLGRLVVGRATGARVGDVEGVTASHLPTRQHLAAGFQLVALAALNGATDVAGLAEAAWASDVLSIRILHRNVFLLDVEHRRRDVQTTVVQLALDPGFIVGTDGRVQQAAADGTVLALRQENIRVAGVPRPLIVEVVDQAGKGGELIILVVRLLDPGIHVLGLVLVPGQPATQHQAQILRQMQTGVAVDAVAPGVVIGDLVPAGAQWLGNG